MSLNGVDRQQHDKQLYERIQRHINGNGASLEPEASIPTLPGFAQMVIDAWTLVMTDPEVDESHRRRFACAFIGVPELALELAGSSLAVTPLIVTAGRRQELDGETVETYAAA